MIKNSIFKAVQNSVTVIKSDRSYSVVVPYYNNDLHGPTTLLNCRDYHHAVAVARARKIALAVYHTLGCPLGDTVAYVEYRVETGNYQGQRWQSVARDIAKNSMCMEKMGVGK
jgi:hypothetical protein